MTTRAMNGDGASLTVPYRRLVFAAFSQDFRFGREVFTLWLAMMTERRYRRHYEADPGWSVYRKCGVVVIVKIMPMKEGGS